MVDMGSIIHGERWLRALAIVRPRRGPFRGGAVESAPSPQDRYTLPAEGSGNLEVMCLIALTLTGAWILFDWASAVPGYRERISHAVHGWGGRRQTACMRRLSGACVRRAKGFGRSHGS
jgi:hypothetical protein